MVKICCVEGCEDEKGDVTYFKFPNSRALRRRWLGAFTPAWKVTLESVVCSRHFPAHQYHAVRGKWRLKGKIVPSIFNGKTQTQPPETEPDQEAKAEENKEESKEEAPSRTSDSTEDKPPDTDKTTDHKQEEVPKIDASAIDNEDKDNLVRRTDPSDPADTTERDIEDIITNYLIKQIRPLNNETDKQAEESSQEQTRADGQGLNGGEMNGGTGEEANVIDVDQLKDPVFIEVSVDKGGEEQSNRDCLMLLESVQCEVDPSSLVFPDAELLDNDDNSDVVDLGEKKNDPISLLTSSDEDEVIIEEPKIDCVEVSDETDEDDVPLVKLVEKPAEKNTPKRRPAKAAKAAKATKATKAAKKPKAQTEPGKVMWGLCDYYCVQCRFRTASRAQYRRHAAAHATVVRICPACSYTTASEAQFARHRRKHHDERRFRCHLCDYRARHNMSLVYHLKSHDAPPPGAPGPPGPPGPRGPAVHACRHCDYRTKRLTDMTRHVARRHEPADDDDD